MLSPGVNQIGSLAFDLWSLFVFNSGVEEVRCGGQTRGGDEERRQDVQVRTAMGTKTKWR